ncbi:hypothetical protein BDV96DRAFT_607541 [Lophiotrema nucula]|uniref:Uncharacterized protein n=1 Tax=Lophiotrema nucula TaxID=690887 RepID=A0A6A5YJD6_9PLEO|nr:hypothetical protein BDV96DRAFT_607541 [Lophiotrema nucula]
MTVMLRMEIEEGPQGSLDASSDRKARRLARSGEWRLSELWTRRPRANNVSDGREVAQQCSCNCADVTAELRANCKQQEWRTQPGEVGLVKLGGGWRQAEQEKEGTRCVQPCGEERRKRTIFWAGRNTNLTTGEQSKVPGQGAKEGHPDAFQSQSRSHSKVEAKDRVKRGAVKCSEVCTAREGDSERLSPEGNEACATVWLRKTAPAWKACAILRPQGWIRQSGLLIAAAYCHNPNAIKTTGWTLALLVKTRCFWSGLRASKTISPTKAPVDALHATVFHVRITSESSVSRSSWEHDGRDIPDWVGRRSPSNAA